MSGFIRVRAADGVRHEFHAPKAWVDAHPEFYRVIDGEPVSKPAPVKYVTKPARGVSRVAESPAPQGDDLSVGDHNKEA